MKWLAFIATDYLKAGQWSLSLTASLLLQMITPFCEHAGVCLYALKIASWCKMFVYWCAGIYTQKKIGLLCGCGHELGWSGALLKRRTEMCACVICIIFQWKQSRDGMDDLLLSIFLPVFLPVYLSIYPSSYQVFLWFGSPEGWDTVEILLRYRYKINPSTPLRNLRGSWYLEYSIYLLEYFPSIFL